MRRSRLSSEGTAHSATEVNTGSTSRVLKQSMPNSTLSRRDFLRFSTLATGALISTGPFIVRGQNLNNKLNIACIGVEGKGASDLDGVAQGNNIVGLCDIDDNRLASAAKKHPNAKKFNDYRKMLEELKEIDAVTVSTPDHHHAPAALRAIKLGKHVYCQKPLTHSVYEARTLTEAARKHKVATLMGNQGHSSDGVRSLCELIWSGALGQVTEVHCWTDRPIWPQGMKQRPPTQPVPESVHWDLFLGPAPERPYAKEYQPFNWRGWWDYGTGALGDMACHIMDPARWSLKLGHPDSVAAEQEGNTEESGPNWSIITYMFPKRGDMGPVKLIWYDGKKKPSHELFGVGADAKLPDNGSLFIGSKGKILVETYGGNPKPTPDSQLKELPKIEKSLPRSPGHYQEFIMACKGQKTPGMADFDYAGPFTEMVLLGNLAVRTGKKIEWDGPKMRAKNVKEAAQYVKSQYRKGWEV
jgi:predicted dehydrogenase